MHNDPIVTHTNAANQWRLFAAEQPGITPAMRALALRAAAEQERQAAGAEARCLCCAKPFGRHAGIVS